MGPHDEPFGSVSVIVAVRVASSTVVPVASIAVTVTAVNEFAPVFSSAATAIFAENGTGTVYTATATDPDAGTTLSYSISGTDAALSIDEFAVALHRDAAVSIDRNLGWHLWGTDLCLQALARGEPRDFASIVEAPLFHNSSTAWQLPEAFHHSAQALLDKYPGVDRIPTLCGELQRKAALAA